MGCIMRLDSEKFISEFLKHFDYRKYQYVLISDDVTSNDKYKNVLSIPKLIPTPNVISEFIDDGFDKGYVKKYFEYLKKPEISSLIAFIVKAALKGFDVVLLCSKHESEYKYLNLICEFIEKEYRLQTCTFKKYKNKPEKFSKIKNKEEVGNILMKKFQKFQDLGIEFSAAIDVDKFIKKLKKSDKKEVYKYCRSKGIKVDDSMSKKEMIKKVKKRIDKK